MATELSRQVSPTGGQDHASSTSVPSESQNGSNGDDKLLNASPSRFYSKLSAASLIKSVIPTMERPSDWFWYRDSFQLYIQAGNFHYLLDLQPGNPLPEGLTEDDYNLDATILRDLLFSTINKKLLLSVPRRATPYEIFQTLRAKFGNRDTLYGNLLELKREYRLTDTSTSAVDRLQSQLNTMCELSLELDSPLDISTQIIMVKEAIPRNLPMVLAYINKDYQDIAALFRELKLILSQMQPRSNHSRKRHCK